MAGASSLSLYFYNEQNCLLYSSTYYAGVTARERSISWIKRLEIAKDVVKGCSPIIIHTDLKSSNILLGKHMKADVADFGLSKPDVDGSHVSSIVRGTVGYLDPEYYTSQQLTEKSNIYSFGIILLELISGQEPISNEQLGANCHKYCYLAFRRLLPKHPGAVWNPNLRPMPDFANILDILLPSTFLDNEVKFFGISQKQKQDCIHLQETEGWI